jgi:hypothetical protein
MICGEQEYSMIKGKLFVLKGREEIPHILFGRIPV